MTTGRGTDSPGWRQTFITYVELILAMQNKHPGFSDSFLRNIMFDILVVWSRDSEL